MTNMRDQIATIVWIHKDYNEGYAAANAIMKLVQARIDQLEKVGKVFIDELTEVLERLDEQVVLVQDLATELNNQEEGDH